MRHIISELTKATYILLMASYLCGCTAMTGNEAFSASRDIREETLAQNEGQVTDPLNEEQDSDPFEALEEINEEPEVTAPDPEDGEGDAPDEVQVMEVSGEEEAKEEEEVLPEEDRGHIKLSVTDPGVDVYTPIASRAYDYRYGPSLILNEDGGMDVWLSSSVSGRGEYDWITYRHSDDGINFGEERVVLSPTPGSLDHLSVCDPDVFYYNGYYYIGYTSTANTTYKGFTNSVFLARAKNPEGPYEKWNGEGFGGMPEPIISYDGPSLGWGRGEPSFVIKDDLIFVYVTMDAYTIDYRRIRTTEVYTADITGEDWPGKLSFQSYAIDRTNSEEGAEYVYMDCDSWDVAYVEEYDKFIAICTNRRFMKDSCLLYFESSDGYRFERVSEINENVICCCHNAGIMADGSGHIKAGDKTMIGYAYAGSNNGGWGAWVTRIAPALIEETEEISRDEEEKENLKQPINYTKSTDYLYPFMISAEPLYGILSEGGEGFYPRIFWYDNLHKKHDINRADVEFSGYDESVVEIEDGVILPKNPGLTSAAITHDGMSREIGLYVMKEGVSSSGRGNIDELFNVPGDYAFSLSQSYCVALRPYARFENGDLLEIIGKDIEKYGLTFEISDPSVCELWNDLIILPKKSGECEIIIKEKNGKSCTVRIQVL